MGCQVWVHKSSLYYRHAGISSIINFPHKSRALYTRQERLYPTTLL
jgi:hypothetical protein